MAELSKDCIVIIEKFLLCYVHIITNMFMRKPRID